MCVKNIVGAVLEDIYNQIRTFFIQLEPIVRILLVGLLAIAGILCIIKVVKFYVNAKDYKKLKIGSIIMAIIFLGLATFIAVI